MHLDDAFGNRQAQPGPALAAGRGIISLLELVEDPGLVSDGDAVTAVLTDINIEGRLSGLELIGALHALKRIMLVATSFFLIASTTLQRVPSMCGTAIVAG